MNNMLPTIIPKSDQINADDLIGRTLTIKVAKVMIAPGTEQPVAIHFEGDGGKPYKACKSMCRVLVQAWGPDANAYVGRSMTLYRDPSVKWGGMEIGGIRISHLSHIQDAMTMALTATKGSRKPFTVHPLALGAAAETKKPTATEWLNALEAELQAAQTANAVAAISNRPQVQAALSGLRNGALERLRTLLATAAERTAVPDDDGEVPEVPATNTTTGRAPSPDTDAEDAQALIDQFNLCQTDRAVTDLANGREVQTQVKDYKSRRPDLHARIIAAIDARRVGLGRG